MYTLFHNFTYFTTQVVQPYKYNTLHNQILQASTQVYNTYTQLYHTMHSLTQLVNIQPTFTQFTTTLQQLDQTYKTIQILHKARRNCT